MAILVWMACTLLQRWANTGECVPCEDDKSTVVMNDACVSAADQFVIASFLLCLLMTGVLLVGIALESLNIRETAAGATDQPLAAERHETIPSAHRHGDQRTGKSLLWEPEVDGSPPGLSNAEDRVLSSRQHSRLTWPQNDAGQRAPSITHRRSDFRLRTIHSPEDLSAYMQSHMPSPQASPITPETPLTNMDQHREQPTRHKEY
jgi:hypothetical protein